MNNQTITEVSRVTFISGVAKIRTPDGEIHDLKVGDILQLGTEVLLSDASVFVIEGASGEAVAATELPADQQPAMPAMGAAPENADTTTAGTGELGATTGDAGIGGAATGQTLAQINQLQQAILAGQDPTQAFEAAAAGVAADAGGGGPGSGNSGFISIDRVGNATIAEAGYDTGALDTAPALQVEDPVAPTVVLINDPTVVVADTNTIQEDEVATGNVLANDSDTDNVLSVASFVVDGVVYSAGNTATLNGIGTIIINPDGSYVFTPVENWNGAMPQVTYTTNTGASETLDITVNPVNDPPIDGNEIHSITEDSENTVVTGNALLNASDIDGNALTVISGTGKVLGIYGTLVLNANGEYTYTLNNSSAIVQALNDGEQVFDTFVYMVSDGQGENVSSSITIEINGADDTAHVAVAEGSDTVVDEHGLLSLPDTSETATGEFEVSATDGISSVVIGGSTFDLDALKGASADSPLLVNTVEGTLSVTGYSSGDDKTATISYSYTLNEAQTHGLPGSATDINLQDTVAVTVNGVGGTSADTELTITIVDDNPVAVDDDTRTVTEDGAIQSVTGNVLSNGDSNNADGPDLPAGFAWDANTAAMALLKTYGTLTLGSDGQYTFTLNNDSEAVQSLKASDTPIDATLTYTLTDADGDSSHASINIVINGTNDTAHVAVAAGSDTDVLEHGLLSVADTSEMAGGQFNVSASDGIKEVVIGSTTFSLADLQGASVSDPLTVTTDDGSTLNITSYSSTDDKSATISYSYVLNAAQMHGLPGSPTDVNLEDTVAVTVHGVGGTEADTTLTITIVDDKPTFTQIDNAIVANDEGVLLGTHNLTFGADGEFRINLSADTDIEGLNYSEAIYNADGSTTITAGTGTNTDGFFVLTINPDGTYKFDLLDARPSVLKTVDFSKIEGGPSLDSLILHSITSSSDSITFTGIGGDTIKPTSAGFGINDGNLNTDDSFSASFTGNLVDSVTFYVKQQSSDALKINWYTDTDSTVQTVSYAADGSFTIDPALDFSTIYFEVVGGNAKLNSFSYSQNLLPENQVLSFAVSATDSDYDTSAIQQLNITLLGGAEGTDIIGSTDHDAIMGTSSAEHIYGYAGDDILTGGEGDDILDGSDGSDTANYLNAAAVVTVNLDAGTATGGDGTDTLTSIENIVGSQFDDSLTGDNNANHISGGAGADTIIGGLGADTLTGGLGNDILTGGDGADIFKWTADDVNIASGAPFSDKITDFSITEGDKLDLSDVLTGDTTTLSNYLDVQASGSNVVVSVYADGVSGGTADMTIVLEGQSADLTALQTYLLTQNGVIH